MAEYLLLSQERKVVVVGDGEGGHSNSVLLAEVAPHCRVRPGCLPPLPRTCLPATARAHCDAAAAHRALFTWGTMGIVHMSRHLVCVHIQIKEAKQRPRAKRLDWPVAARRGEQQAALCRPCY